MAIIIVIVDDSEANSENIRNRKHEIMLLVREDWFDEKHGIEIQKAINNYKRLNPEASFVDALTIAEQVVIDAGATLVPYGSMTLHF